LIGCDTKIECNQFSGGKYLATEDALITLK